MSLSTLRAIIDRWKRDKQVLLLTCEGTDHCRCPVCEGLQNQLQAASDAFQELAKSKKQNDLAVIMAWNEVKACQSALDKHLEESQVQRVGMYLLRSSSLADNKTAVYHVDAKSKYRYPRFWRAVRGVPGCRYTAQAFGKVPFVGLNPSISTDLSIAPLFVQDSTTSRPTKPPPSSSKKTLAIRTPTWWDP